MCEIYAYAGKRAGSFAEELKEFFSHSEEHPNGWGIAVEKDGRMNIEKEPVRAADSKYLSERIEAGVKGNTLIAHIRYATIGSVKYNNCHPFSAVDNSGRQWVLAHNGTIFDYAPMYRYTKVQKGSTDSERILLYLIDVINAALEEKGRRLIGQERFALLDSVFSLMAIGNKLNVILYDGEYLYVHANAEKSLYYRQEKETVTFSTRPLSRGRWKEAPFTQLTAWHRGQLSFEGTAHGRVYVQDDEAVKLLYLAYSQL